MAEEEARKSNSLVASSEAKSAEKWKILLAGASAGLVVDGSLFPLDTVKSRLQSKQGFRGAGGFSNLYRGIQPVLVGSVPSAAIFFIVYESAKDRLEAATWNRGSSLGAASHMLAAATGETVSCMGFSSLSLARGILASEGVPGLYRGFLSTVARDLPFSALQYPIWEHLKRRHLDRSQQPATVLQSALYGCLAGAVSAFATTPLDVAKTRIMLAHSSEKLASGNVIEAMRLVWLEKGIRGLFAGVVPRVVWISSGAAIFLGTYETAIKLLT